MDFQDFEKDLVAKSKSTHIPGLDWEDIAQDLRITLWQKMSRYDPKRGSPRTFAVKVMRNRIIDLARKHMVTIRVPASWAPLDQDKTEDK